MNPIETEYISLCNMSFQSEQYNKLPNMHYY